MSVGIVITPGGQLRVERTPENVSQVGDAVAASLSAEFEKSSAAGLVLLASHTLPHELPAALVFWRGFARRFFQAVCHEGEGGFDKWASLPPPDEEELSQLVAQAPPMRGLEYLNADRLRLLWNELRARVVFEAGHHPQGPS